MNIYAKENRKHATIFAVCSIIFVLACSAALLAGISILSLEDLNSGAETAKDYGYDVYYYDGEVVTPTAFYAALDNYYYTNEEGAYILDQDAYQDSENEGNLQEKSDYLDFDKKEGFYVEHIEPNFTYDTKLYETYMGKLWMVEIIALVLIPFALIIGLIHCGQKNEDGTIRLYWFDKIFSDIQLLAAVAISAGVLVVYILMNSWFTTSDEIAVIVNKLFNNFPDIKHLIPWIFTGSDGYITRFLHPSWVMPVLAVVASVLIFTFDFAILSSIAKKIKNRSLLRSTILGAIISSILDSLDKSPRLFLKVYGSLFLFVGTTALLTFLTIFSLLSYNGWLSFAILIFWIIFGVISLRYISLKLSQYNSIKSGLAEIQQGNIEYKFPAYRDKDLNNLAEAINSVTDLQSDAIDKELRSQRLRSELISNVSHDLRTPLTSMVSYVDLLKNEGLDSPNAREYLDIISEKTHRLHKLTENLFEAAKASSGDIPVELAKIDFGAMAEQAIAELEDTMTANNLSVIYSCKAENSEVMADGNLLWRVIENLLTNVSKYALPGTRAYVDLVDKGANIAMEVKNMSRESLNISTDELMERFQRGDDSRNTDGSGLGLAIANDLTELMHGKFEIFIEGDLFKATVELPKAPKA